MYTIQCRGPKAHILDHYGGKWIHTNKRLKLVRGQADLREQPPTSQAAHCDALMSSTPTSVPIHALGDFAEALADAKARNMVLARQKRDKETELATQEAKSNAAQAKVEESKDKLKRASSSISTLQKDIAQKKDSMKKAKTAADASIAALKKS